MKSRADQNRKAGPESDLLTEDYGFLPLMQSSNEDRELLALSVRRSSGVA